MAVFRQSRYRYFWEKWYGNPLIATNDRETEHRQLERPFAGI